MNSDTIINHTGDNIITTQANHADRRLNISVATDPCPAIVSDETEGVGVNLDDVRESNHPPIISGYS